MDFPAQAGEVQRGRLAIVLDVVDDEDAAVELGQGRTEVLRADR